MCIHNLKAIRIGTNLAYVNKTYCRHISFQIRQTVRRVQYIVYLAWIETLANLTTILVFGPSKRTRHPAGHWVTAFRFTHQPALRHRLESVVVAITTSVVECLTFVTRHVEQPFEFTRIT